MNKTIILLALIVPVLMSSCVSKKKFDMLQSEKDDLAGKIEQLESDFNSSKESQKREIESLKSANMSLSSEKEKLGSNMSKMESQLSQVQSSVDDKQRQLDMLRSEINAAFADVETAVFSSNQRIETIENFLYLDFDDDIDFKSGSTAVNPNDKETLQALADMLTENPNVALIIEGHTDGRSISNEKYKDNWDLSVARATEVVRKLISMGVNPEQLIASGRSEYMHAVDEDRSDPSTLAANRRTEAIVVPNIGKLYRVNQSLKK
jgi:chemotaxis protein MotB